MSGSLGVVAFEAELNGIVQEYLDFVSYDRTLQSFKDECMQNGKPIAKSDAKPKSDQKLLALQNELVQLFQYGERDKFFKLWDEHLSEELRNSDSTAQKLEFYLNIYFAIYPYKMGNSTKADIEDSMGYFKQYIESRGANLSQTTEFLPFYALPFVPNPQNHPTYKELFSEAWVPDIQIRLEKFLTLALQSTAQPRLFDLYKGTNKEMQKQMAQMQQQIVDAEKKTMTYMKRYNRVQADYHNLIGITADLVDTLEETVKGKVVTPEYLQAICQRLFSNQVRATMDFTRPGTAADVLRASMATAPKREEPTPLASINVVPTLDYERIKQDLINADERRQCLLLQALRWKLTRSAPAERDVIMQDFISNDIMGCVNANLYRLEFLKLLQSPNEIVQQYTARLINAFASLCDGRSYISESADHLEALTENLCSDEKDSITRENVLGALQKLSLRRNLQSQMIDNGIIPWLVSVLEDNDSLSDYTLEYSVALLMNLCLRNAGKRKCIPIAHQVLKVLSDLMGHENQEIIPYVNGALYSILAIPSIREEAKAMDMEDLLKMFIRDGQPDMNRQIEFIIKQLNSDEEPDDGESDEEDEDEDEEDQDAMEADLDKAEVLRPQPGELLGDKLLTTQYSNKPSTNNNNNLQNGGIPRKKKSSLQADQDLLTRPITPQSRKGGPALQPKDIPKSSGDFSRSVSQSSRPYTSDRPPTRSGSRPGTQDSFREPPPRKTDAKGSATVSKALGQNVKLAEPQANSGVRPSSKAKGPGGEEYTAAFSARPKVPRTPDPNARPGSRGTMSPAPKPQYSESLPSSRPGTGQKAHSSRSGSGGTPSLRSGPSTPKKSSSRTGSGGANQQSNRPTSRN
ncbi:unnamed protein product [Owenia fusiformis]|uniref:LisH domain-containing protein ARMC9 n=1 Tax=Owenia fusiformis TaxID=6347 RepID=A0A8J1UEM0_OWEFU|nr:unnamed protein product [Owenia fusiformis]